MDNIPPRLIFEYVFRWKQKKQQLETRFFQDSDTEILIRLSFAGVS